MVSSRVLAIMRATAQPLTPEFARTPRRRRNARGSAGRVKSDLWIRIVLVLVLVLVLGRSSTSTSTSTSTRAATNSSRPGIHHDVDHLALGVCRDARAQRDLLRAFLGR